MYPVELVVRWSGTHCSLAPDTRLAPDTPQIPRPIELVDFLEQRKACVALWACLSKYPVQNTRQASVFAPLGERIWHILYISFLFEFFILPRRNSRLNGISVT